MLLQRVFFSYEFDEKEIQKLNWKKESVLNCKKKWGLFVFKQIEIYIPGIKPLCMNK